MERPNIFTILALILISLFAGLVQFARMFSSEELPEIITRNYVLAKVVKLLASLIIASFTGLIVGLFIWEWVESVYLMLGIAGVGAYGGGKTLDKLAEYYIFRNVSQKR